MINLGLNWLPSYAEDRAGQRCTTRRVTFACGIYGVEEEEAWLLAKRFSNLEALYGASIDSLMSYNLLNEAVAVNTYNFFRHPLNVSALNELQTEGGLKVRHG